MALSFITNTLYYMFSMPFNLVYYTAYYLLSFAYSLTSFTISTSYKITANLLYYFVYYPLSYIPTLLWHTAEFILSPSFVVVLLAGFIGLLSMMTLLEVEYKRRTKTKAAPSTIPSRSVSTSSTIKPSAPISSSLSTPVAPVAPSSTISSAPLPTASLKEAERLPAASAEQFEIEKGKSQPQPFLGFSREHSKVNQLLNRATVHDVLLDQWRDHGLITITDNKPLEKALELFKRHEILSLPVVRSQDGKVVGLLDVLDVIHHLSDVSETNESHRQQKWDFMLKDVHSLMESIASDKQYGVVSSEASMLSAIKQLSDGHHRLIVVDKEKYLHPQNVSASQVHFESIVGLLTQTDIIKFLAKHPMWLSDDFDKSVSDLRLVEGEREILQVKTDTPAIEAFRTIYHGKVHGCAIVDENGKLMANLSASNVKGINRRNFDLLRLPVSDFLAHDRQRKWYHVPICAEPSDTLKDVAMQFASTGIHRMYVTSEDGRPVGLISLTDVLRHVANTQQPLTQAPITQAQ